MLKIVKATTVTRFPMASAIDVNAEAFIAAHRGSVTTPPYLSMPVKDDSGVSMGNTLVKAAHVRGGGPPGGALALKVVSVRAANADKGLPTVPAVVIVLDAVTGHPAALVDGTSLTVLRTAAGSGAAARSLAAPTASRLVVFGAGAQAKGHVEAMHAVRPLTSVVVVNRTVSRAEDLLAELRPEQPGVIGSAVALADDDGIRAALSTADLVCTCTNASRPLFKGEWLQPGTFIAAVGAYTKDMAELDEATVRRSKIVVDTTAALNVGDLLPLLADGSVDTHVAGTIGAALAGAVDLAAFGSPSQDVTLFKSVGVGEQDTATAAAIVATATDDAVVVDFSS